MVGFCRASGATVVAYLELDYPEKESDLHLAKFPQDLGHFRTAEMIPHLGCDEKSLANSCHLPAAESNAASMMALRSFASGFFPVEPEGAPATDDEA